MRTLDAEDEALIQKHTQAAIDAVMERRYLAAANAAEAALDIDPRGGRARAALAMTILKRPAAAYAIAGPELAEAEFELRLAQQLAPDDAFVGWIAAVFLAEAGHMSAAAAAAEQALLRATSATAAERAALLGLAGTYRHELGEERTAIPHLQGYVALRPEDAALRYRLGCALLRVAAEPQGIPPTSWLVAQRQAEDAARAFTRVADAVTGDLDAHLAAVTAHLRAVELASDRLDRLQASAKQQVEMEREGNRRAAMERLDIALERFPGAADVRFQAGVVADAAGNRAHARECYRAALELDPTHVASALNLAAALTVDGERAAAAALLRALLDRGGGIAITDAERRRIDAWLRSD